MSPVRTARQRITRLAGGPHLRFGAIIIALTIIVGAPLYAASSTPAADRDQKWSWDLPEDFPTPRVPKGNPMTNAKVEVGRRLFYDKRLSGNGKQSCGSCHIQALAFTDGIEQAIGSTGQRHPRNSQSLVNVAYLPTLTWANPSLVTLESQMQVPLFGTDPVELGVTDANKSEILARIRKDPWYAKRFVAAFPKKKKAPVTWAAIVDAIASFQRSIVSADSKYDRYLAGKAKLLVSERRGMDLFNGERAECHHCHGTFIFNDQTTYESAPLEQPKFHNTGLYNLAGTGAFPKPNRGLFELTGKPTDMGRFRAPSLRNVELTAPYMHDGSMATLEEVLQHYTDGGRVIAEGPNAGDGRKNHFKDPLITGLKLSQQDRDDIIAFLKTLTDRTVTTSKRFSDPFATDSVGNEGTRAGGRLAP